MMKAKRDVSLEDSGTILCNPKNQRYGRIP